MLNPNENKPSFLDRGTLLALAMILVFWFGWAKFMEWKYPAAPKVAVSEPAPEASTPASDTKVAAPTSSTQAHVAAPKDEKLLAFDDQNLSFQVSSRGMGLKDIVLKKYQARDGKPIVLGTVAQDLPFATQAFESGHTIDFAMEKVGVDTFIGRADLNGGRIEKTLKINPATYTVETSIDVTGNLDAFRGLITVLSEPILPIKSGGIFGGTHEGQDWFVRHGNEQTRHHIDPAGGLKYGEANVSLAALSSHYFSLAVVDKSDLLPRFETSLAGGAPVTTGKLIYQPVSKLEKFTIKFVGFAGPKEFGLLARTDANLARIIDFGVFGVLGKPILSLLKYLYSLFGNWGWAIVALTIIVRLLVLPFNAYSYKSMKAMQKIQPEMNRIRERYKDKPSDMRMQMNQEIMQLMKDHKASPLGGCLPMLLQLPPFFALYQVLGQSIELYRAPFIFWIHDLSDKDPFFVLPVMMGITMFVQQKITPTTMDPQQAKIMLWMPVIFSFFMLSLPSGLTLYIFVSTLFGIVQQYFLMREKPTVEGRVKEAKA